jgi:hypothetical protein
MVTYPERRELVVVVIQCINNLLDALPSVSKLFWATGLTNAISTKISIEEFDLFEDLVDIILKVSQERAEGLFESGILSSLLSFDLEFVELNILQKGRIALFLIRILIPSCYNCFARYESVTFQFLRHYFSDHG